MRAVLASTMQFLMQFGSLRMQFFAVLPIKLIRRYAVRKGNASRLSGVNAKKQHPFRWVVQAVLKDVDCGSLVQGGGLDHVSVFHRYSQNPSLRSVQNAFPLHKIVSVKPTYDVLLTAPEYGMEARHCEIQRLFGKWIIDGIRTDSDTFDTRNR